MMAYTDPGSGSMAGGFVILGLIVLVVAVVYGVRHREDKRAMAKLAVALIVAAVLATFLFT